jgi:hypothetical protein
MRGTIMTTIGKILVFLTFIAALGMGGLMVYVAKTNPNWKVVVDDRDEYIKRLKDVADQETTSRKKTVDQVENLKKQLDAALIEARGQKEGLIAQLNEKEAQRKKFEDQMGQITVSLELAKKEAARLQSELKLTLNVIADREKTILKVTEDLAAAKNAQVAAENERDTAKNRALALLEQLKEKERYIAKLTEKVGPAAAAPAKMVNNPNFRNPPPVFVEGKLVAVDAVNKTLVKISLGSDEGVNKDNTLLVYRKTPAVQFLGHILVTDADFHHSYGRLIVPSGQPAPALMPGDEVASKLAR